MHRAPRRLAGAPVLAPLARSPLARAAVQPLADLACPPTAHG